MALADILVNTICSAGYYAVLALAVVFVYSTNRVLLFCVGELGALAAFVAYSVHAHAGVGGVAGALLAIVSAVALTAVITAALFWVIERLGPQGSHFVGTIITIAFGLVLQGAINTIWQGEIYRFEQLQAGPWSLGGIQVSGLSLLVGLVGLALVSILIFLLRRSPFGYELQALADNRVLSLLRGIPVNRRIIEVGALVGALAALGGLLNAAVTSVSLEGASVGVTAIVAAIVGGLTSPVGAVIGALLLALVENLTVVSLGARYATLTPVLLLVVFLLVRPYGLSGRPESIRRV